MFLVVACKTNVVVLSFFVVFIGNVCVLVRAFRHSGVYETPNVRTVLFHKNDLTKECWTPNDAGLLVSRYLMQALLPRKLPTDPKAFLEYVMLCVRILKAETESSKSKELLVDALADTFGGYMQAFILPVTKAAYYDGIADRSVCWQLNSLESDFKTVLKTNGGNWAGPVTAKHRMKTCPLRLKRVKNACDNIIFGSQKQKVAAANRQGMKAGGIMYRAVCSAQRIPIPFFDDCKRPHAIAVPLKDCSLYSLTSNASEGVLIRYYETSVSCVNQRCKKHKNGDCKRSRSEFDKRYYKFLKKYVVPRLRDDAWYPAFYGVVPLMKIVKRSGGFTSSEPSVERNITLMPSKVHSFWNTDKAYFAFMLSPLFIAFWILLLVILFSTACIYTKLRPKHEEMEEEEDKVSGDDVYNDSWHSDVGKTGKPGESSGDKPTTCVYCTCDHKAKAGFQAKFYCRTKPPQCCDETCGKRNDEQDPVSSVSSGEITMRND